MGTPRYMSPEQARGFELDARTDLWSLGVILYEMVTGRRPFDGATPTDVLAAILRAEPVPLDLHALQAPQTFGRIVERMLAKNVVERFTSARELRLALAALKSELNSGAGRAVALRAVPAATSGLPGIDSIAVLPFTNTSGDPESEYLSDGITESLINKLSALPGLRVVPRSTALRYKGAEGDLERAVRELNVRVLLTGSIRQRHDTLTVQVELVDAVANCQLWGHKSTRRFADISALEEDIAHDIVKACGSS